MTAYAQAQFEINRPVDGVPEIVHLQKLADRGEPMARARLAALPKLPPSAAHVWRWFTDLNQTRQASGLGIGRLTRAEIHAFEADELVSLEPWERAALMRIDALHVAEMARQKSQQETR